MVWPRTSPGWCMSALSSRTSQCSINPSAPMGPSRVMTSPMTANATAISALPGRNSGSAKKSIECRAPLVDEDGMMRYRASKLDCESCPLKPHCCPTAPARKIPRSIHEGARDMARHRGHRRLCHLKARTKEGRDAVRAPEAYSEARSVAITRTKRRPRRVPPRRHCPKPPQARHADPNANADLSNVKRHHRSSAFSRMRHRHRDYLKSDFFNDIRRERPLPVKRADRRVDSKSGRSMWNENGGT